MPYAVGPYSFVHPHHSIATFSGPIPSHRVTLPPAHMPMYHPFQHHPGHPQHPPHPHHPSPAAPPPPGPYYTPQPPPTPGTRHLYTMQQPMPVNVILLRVLVSVCNQIYNFMYFVQVQAGVAGPLPGQNSLPGPALVQPQPMISTVRAQPQVISNIVIYT